MGTSTLLHTRWVVITFVLALVIFLLSSSIFTAFQSFGVGILFGAGIIAFIQFIDSVLLKKVDTYNEIILAKNVAYAVFYLALVVAVCGGFVCSTAIFFTWK